MNSKITKEIDLAVKDKISPVLTTLSKAIYALTQAIAKFHQEQDKAFDATLKNLRLEIKGHEDANKELKKRIDDEHRLLDAQKNRENFLKYRKDQSAIYSKNAEKIQNRLHPLEYIKSNFTLPNLQKKAESKFTEKLSLYESGKINGAEMDAAMSAYKGASTAIAGFTVALAVGETIVRTVNEGFKLLGVDLGSFINGVKENIKSLTAMKSGMATYSFGSSLISNSAARNQALEYGLDSASNFAFTKAQEMYGISSREDLFYMNANQRNAFMESMETFKSYYSNLEKSGALDSLQEVQLELAQMKMEISMEFLNWFSENKMTILGLMRVSVDALKSLMNVVSRIANFFIGNNEYLSEGVSLTGKSSGKSITINNSFRVSGNSNTSDLRTTANTIFSQAANAL